MFSVTGDLAVRMVQGAIAYMEREEHRINALNVFPVPDGDTGTNMILTVKAALEAADPTGDLSTVAGQMAFGALRGARGNSGTIVSQFFQGFYNGVKGLEQADPFQVAMALESASKSAYAAVLEPREGTILSVGRRSAEAAVATAQSGAKLIDVIEAALKEAALALEETTELLDVLKEAGVVDAGGEGLVVGFQGAVAALHGHDDALADLPIPDVLSNGRTVVDTHTSDAHRRLAIHHSDTITFAYCTEFLIHGEDLPADDVKARLAPLGDSLMVVGSGDLLKVHVHTDRPGQALEIACDYGDLSEISIDNMVHENRKQADMQDQMRHDQRTKTAVVAVSSGRGFEQLLLSQGVAKIIPGGQSFNPSTGDIVEAIESVASDQVIVFPNNRNIILSAEQAAKLSDKEVVVIPTINVSQCVAATFDYDPDDSLAEVVPSLHQSVDHVRVGEVTTAVRDAALNGITIQKEDYIGVIDGEVVASGTDLSDVIKQVVSDLSPGEGELVTVYGGEDVSDETAKAHIAEISDAWPDVDVEYYNGGQPVYLYWIAVE